MITLGDDLVEDVEHALIVHLLFLKLLLALADVHDSLAKHRADFVAHGLAFTILPGKLGTISLSHLFALAEIVDRNESVGEFWRLNTDTELK